PSVVNPLLSSTVCLGGNPSALTFTIANGAGTPTYQWYSNTVNNTTTGTVIVGETNAIFTPPANALGSLYYYCLINFPAISGSCANISTNTAEVEVITAAVIDENPLSTQTLCVGTTISNPLTVSFSGGTGTPSYQWFSNTIDSNSGGNAIAGATSAAFTPNVFTGVGVFYYYVNITFAGSGCGLISSAVAAIDVVADPQISSQPLNTQTLCQNAVPSSLSVTAIGGLGTIYNYQWFSSTTNSNSGGILIPGASNATFVPPTAVVGTIYYYCIITQAIGSGCNVTSNTSAVIINASPSINLPPFSNSYCVNQTPLNLTVTYTAGTGIPTYQWYSNANNSTTGGTLISGATTANYPPPTDTAGNVYYYCIITFPDLSGGCEVITSDTALISVNPFPIIASSIATICSNNSFLITPMDGNGNLIPSGTTYIWTLPTVNPPGSLSGFSAQPVAQTEISQTLVNNTINPATITYTVTPKSGICTGDDFTVTITVNPAISPNVVVNNNDCFGVNNASITTNIMGGIPPYDITWMGPNGFQSNTTAITNLEPGAYTILIEDAGNCPFTNSYVITEPDDIVISVADQNNSSCFGSNDGGIDIEVYGGTGGYFYTWTKNSLPFGTTQDLSGLSAGDYTVSVTDVNNCGPKTFSFTITEPPLLVVSLLDQTNVDCFGTATGTINIEVAGGTTTSPYTFLWTGPGSFTDMNQNLTGLFAGTYNLIVTDTNGCQKSLEVTLTQSTPIVLNYATTAITCYGANDASFNATISGGNAPYQFTWSNLSTALNQDNLSAGDYTITITDNFGCIKMETINIPEAPIFRIDPIVKNVSCFGANNGSIQINLTGGIAPVTLTWSDGSTAGLTRNNLPPGTYTATISDWTPCYIVRTFTIIEPQLLVIAANLINPMDCANGGSGTIDLIVSGGTPPFTYSWSNGSTTEDLNNLVAGNYAVVVTDFNGCTTSAQYALIRPEPLKIDVATKTDFNCELRQVTTNFVAQASGGLPPYQFQWSSGNVSGANNEIMNTDLNGTVILTVEDAIGCTQTFTVNVDNTEIGEIAFQAVSVGYTSYGMYSIEDPIQFNSTITGDYESVYWDFGDGTTSTDLEPIHIYTIPKDYVVTLTVTYPFGCVYKYVITLAVEKGYILVVPTAFTPNNDSLNDAFRPVTKNLKNVVMHIYDSWGSLIYSEKGDVIKGWDAKIKGFNAENGNYYSKVTAETFYGAIVYENQTFVLIK
ncbi:MAG: T9SS type B sorting domain-containing protein, partial [Flavobacterium sp.]